METVLVTQDKSAEDSVAQAKEILANQDSVEIKGKGRDTVKAVDVAELLKLENFKTGKISTQTEEEPKEEKALRISTISIEILK